MSDTEDHTLSLPSAPAPREEGTLSHPGIRNDTEGTLSHPGQRDVEGTLSYPGAKKSEPDPDGQIWKIGDFVDGKYDVTGIVGKGGMGIVYKVKHREWNIEMAVKTPLPHLVRDVQARARFLREAQTWVDLGLHPNIVQCWYVRELTGLPRVFADYISGGSLKNWYQEGKVQPGQWAPIIDLIVQACDGLDYAHERGAVHRDVKPGNMLMTPEGRLCVTDFGLVKLAGVDDILSSDSPNPAPHDAGDDATILTMTGSVLGTPEYGAPEQWGEARHVDARADIYALGIVLYELCCGRRPFDDGSHRESAQAIIGRHLASTPPDPRNFQPGMPESLALLCLQCLSKKPDARPQSMRLLREALAAIYARVEGKPFPREIPKASEARAAALNNRAVSLWDLNQPGEAMARWSEALKLDPHHAEAVYNKSLLEWRRGTITDLDAEDRLRAVNDPLKLSRLYLGFLNLERLAAHEAELDLYEALKNSLLAKDGAAWRALGHAQMAQEHFEAAHTSYAAALQRMDKDAAARECSALAAAKTRLKDGTLLFPSRQCIKTIDKQSGSMRALALTPDGNYLLGARGDFMLCLWDLPWGNYIRGFAHAKEINAFIVTPDGRNIVTGGGDGVLHFWDINTERESGDFYGKGHIGSIRALAMAPEGGYFLSAGSDTSVRLWRIPDGDLIASFRGHEQSVEAVAVSLDGTTGFSASDDGTVRHWDLNNGSCLRALDMPVSTRWKVVTLSPDGKSLIAGGTGGSLCLWEIATYKLTRHFKGHRGTVLSTQITPDGKHLVSGSDDRTVRVWEIATARCVRTFSGHAGAVQGIAITSDGCAAVSGALDMQNHPLRIWDLALEKAPSAAVVAFAPELRGVRLDAHYFQAPLVVCKVESIEEAQAATGRFSELLKSSQTSFQQRDYYAAAEYLKDARAVAGYERDPAALEMNAQLSKVLPRTVLTTGYLSFSAEAHTKGVSSLALSPNGKFGVSAALDGPAAKLWDLASGTSVRSFEGHKRGIHALAIAGDNRTLVSAGADDVLRVWELSETGNCLRTLEGHKNAVSAVVISADSRLALSGSHDRSVGLWEISSGRRIKTFDGHPEPVSAVALTSDGRMAISASRDGSIRLWSLASGSCMKEFSGHVGAIFAICVTSKGRLISAGEDKTLRIWNLESGHCEHVGKIPGGAAHTVAAAPDGRFIFSGGNEGPETLLRCWEVLNGACVQTFGVHPKGIQTLAVSSDGCALFSGGNEGLVRGWALEWELNVAKRAATPAPTIKRVNSFAFDLPAAGKPPVPPPPLPAQKTVSVVPPPPAASAGVTAPAKPKRRLTFDDDFSPPKK